MLDIGANDMFGAMQKQTKKRLFLPVAGQPSSGVATQMPIGQITVITGDQKTGKSQSAADARRPIYWSFEAERLTHLTVPRMSPIYTPEGLDASDFPYPYNTVLSEVAVGKKFDFMIAWLNDTWDAMVADNGQTYGTVVFDTFDTLVDQVALSYAQDQRGVQSGIPGDYGPIYSKMLPFLDRIFATPRVFDVIIICHLKQDDKSGDMVLALPQKIRGRILDHSSMILHVDKAVTGLNRFQCHNIPGLPCGDGTGKLPKTLPTTMSAVRACWTGEDPEQYQPQVVQWITVADEPLVEEE